MKNARKIVLLSAAAFVLVLLLGALAYGAFLKGVPLSSLVALDETIPLKIGASACYMHHVEPDEEEYANIFEKLRSVRLRRSLSFGTTEQEYDRYWVIIDLGNGTELRYSKRNYLSYIKDNDEAIDIIKENGDTKRYKVVNPEALQGVYRYSTYGLWCGNDTTYSETEYRMTSDDVCASLIFRRALDEFGFKIENPRWQNDKSAARFLYCSEYGTCKSDGKTLTLYSTDKTFVFTKGEIGWTFDAARSDELILNASSVPEIEPLLVADGTVFKAPYTVRALVEEATGCAIGYNDMYPETPVLTAGGREITVYSREVFEDLRLIVGLLPLEKTGRTAQNSGEAFGPVHPPYC